MNSREILYANLEHKSPERPGLCFDNGRRSDMVIAGVGDPEGYRQKRWQEGNREYYDDKWGNVWVRMKHGPVKGEIFKPVMEDWSMLKEFSAPRYDREATADRLKAGFAADESGIKFKVAEIGGWIFDNARYLRRLDVYLLDMALYPEELYILHDMVARMYEQLILSAAQAGADAVFIGEDMGTQTGLLFSPAMFRDYFKPLYTRLMGIAHENGMKVLQHSCGQNREILDDLIDCGVSAFQFDQPALYDMEELARLFRTQKVALWSPVDIQKVLPSGDRDYIRSETFRMCRIFEGCLIVKNYPDLPGIGVDPLWDQWAYEAVLETFASRA